MFETLIAIDWSGAGTDAEPLSGLRAARWTRGGAADLVTPSSEHWRRRNWSRNAIVEWLAQELGPESPRTAVALDFTFSLPLGADQSVFESNGWHEMTRAVRDVIDDHETARAAATSINQRERFRGHGPFRFNENRVDPRFYLDWGVSYYRLAELVVPQAISAWYLGAGATVGFHGLTGMAALARLMERRKTIESAFKVWPQESVQCPMEGHVLIEAYPAALPAPQDYGPCETRDDKDAWRMLQWMVQKELAGGLEQSLQVPLDALGRFAADPEERVQFEGWIMGVS